MVFSSIQILLSVSVGSYRSCLRFIVIVYLIDVWFVHVFYHICSFSAKEVVSFELIEPHRAVEFLSQLESGADALWTTPFFPIFLYFKI